MACGRENRVASRKVPWTWREAGQHSNIDAGSDYDEICRDAVLNDGEKKERLLVLKL